MGENVLATGLQRKSSDESASPLNTNWTVPKKWNPFKWRAMSVSPHHQRHVTRLHGASGLEFRDKLRSRHITDFQSLSGEDSVRDARMKERGIGPYRGKKAGAGE